MDPKKMRIIFMGTPEFAVESLRALCDNNYNVVAVITAPDKPAGRGRKLSSPAVKEFALEYGIPVLQPERLKNPEFLEQLRSFKADLQIVVAFRMLPEVVWDMPSYGTFNLHASLLPQYRGAAPINWAVINGETETGVTTFMLSHEIDTGNILLAEKISISPTDTAGNVHDTLMVTGAQLVLKTVDAIALQNISPLPQEKLIGTDSELKHAPKIFRGDMRIDWNKPAIAVYNLIRGLSPYPGTWTLLEEDNGNSTEVKIFLSELFEGSPSVPGTICSDGKEYLRVSCANGWLAVTELQLSGKKRMKTVDFLRGFKGFEDGKFRFI